MKSKQVNFDTDPKSYKHWALEFDNSVATLKMKVDPISGLRDDYELKLNSYDLGVDIELYDAVQRIRFEHPEVKSVIVTSADDKVFCAGANIQMLAGSSHHHKVNFCKFTNETRNSIEDSTEFTGQTWIAAVNGTAAGGGYELALACDEIVLVDDKASTVSFPEVPLLAVLPGTGGLTRVVDKRHVRRDLADVFAVKAEGVKGAQAVKWGLVDEVVPKSRFTEYVIERALKRAENSDRPWGENGIELVPLKRKESGNGLSYPHLEVRYDRELASAFFEIKVPEAAELIDLAQLKSLGASFWLLALCRELDDAVLRMRFNEPEIGSWVFETEGNPDVVLATDELIKENADDWLVREIRHYLKRTFNRLELSSRTLVTLIKPGSCFVGTLAELVLVADRSLMLEGTFSDDDSSPAPQVILTEVNDGWYHMVNRISRLQSRYYGRPDELEAVRTEFGKQLSAKECDSLGVVTFTFDEIDWDDEVRILLEEQASFSPDALTGLQANCRFVGPETMESKIFSRLSAWQNWIFQRPNAVGPSGALQSYGTGSRPTYNHERI
ncbi:MAG: benzoyl-CoA-dihydrodiol lyase [Acidimicrobiaceae bacterium]|nr:benzoyl-CoA-dihydrodiol lyase [Acidimicrobiaceae bacterium]